MELPEYITREEVQRVCNEIGISDWTKMTGASIDLEEAKIIQEKVGGETTLISVEQFRNGLEVELEHGLTFTDANVTNNHPLLTGLIVLAHFKESLDYYKLLEVAELEGDLMKAVAKGNAAKTKAYYKRLARAKIALNQAQLNRLT